MKAYALEDASQGQWVESTTPIKQYYSVEISTRELEHLHQFKIWNIEPESMCVLVKADSEILRSLKVGETMTMRYYTTDSLSPPTEIETEISHITKEEQGRFKGHYLVGLAILDPQMQQKLH
jgi:hypothetical protein